VVPPLWRLRARPYRRGAQVVGKGIGDDANGIETGERAPVFSERQSAGQPANGGPHTASRISAWRGPHRRGYCSFDSGRPSIQLGGGTTHGWRAIARGEHVRHLCRVVHRALGDQQQRQTSTLTTPKLWGHKFPTRAEDYCRSTNPSRRSQVARQQEVTPRKRRW
jgi:hypothetical protein